MSENDTAVLFGYFCSTAACRERIALGPKGLSADHGFVHVRKGEQAEAPYLESNPAGLVPYWTEGELHLGQSPAIIEYLDETHPQRPLLPKGAEACAIAREIAQAVCCDIHPVGNLRVLKRLIELGVGDAERAQWSRHWIETGFASMKARLKQLPGPFAFADQPMLADIGVVPQVFNARRFGVDLSASPRIGEVDAAAAQLGEFAAAESGRQPDAA